MFLFRVHFQQTIVAKASIAIRTLEWSFLWMNAHVYAKVVSVLERFRAQFARIWPFTGVSHHMLRNLCSNKKIKNQASVLSYKKQSLLCYITTLTSIEIVYHRPNTVTKAADESECDSAELPCATEWRHICRIRIFCLSVFHENDVLCFSWKKILSDNLLQCIDMDLYLNSKEEDAPVVLNNLKV